MIAGGENLAGKAGLGFPVFFFYTLPDSSGSPRIIAGVNDIVKRQVIRFPFILFRNGHRINLVYQNIQRRVCQHGPSYCRAHHSRANGHIQLLAHGRSYMVLLSVAHFMSQHHRNFIRIVRQAVKAFIHAHHMAHTAKRVKAFLFIDKIQIGFLINSRINSRNTLRQAGHHLIQLLLAVIVFGNAIFFFITLKKLLASFFRLVIILNQLINLLMRCSSLHNSSKHIAQYRSLCHRNRLHRGMQAGAYNTAYCYRPQSLFPGICLHCRTSLFN